MGALSVAEQYSLFRALLSDNDKKHIKGNSPVFCECRPMRYLGRGNLFTTVGNCQHSVLKFRLNFD